MSIFADFPAEGVFIFSNDKVEKEYLYPEFQSFLDGLFTLDQFKNQKTKAAYVLINPALHISHCVLFYIDIDQFGSCDRNWNIPLRQMAENAGEGPSLGYGPIKLARRSHCPVSWHQHQLWDPSSKEKPAELVVLQQAVLQNRLALSTMGMHEEDNIPMVTELVDRNNADYDLPTLDEMVFDEEALADIPIGQINSIERHFKDKISRLMQAQRRTLEEFEQSKKETIAKHQRILRNELQTFRIKEKEYRRVIEARKLQLEKLKKLATDLQLKLKTQEQQATIRVERLETMLERTHSDSQSQIALEKEVFSLSKQLEAKDKSLSLLESTLVQKDDLIAHYETKESISGETVDDFIESMQNRKCVFVIYHPGAGHISIQPKRVLKYLEDPTQFVADKCGVTKNHYVHWLSHYDNTQCKHPECNKVLKRIDSPQDFISGKSDYCDDHRQNGSATKLILVNQ